MPSKPRRKRERRKKRTVLYALFVNKVFGTFSSSSSIVSDTSYKQIWTSVFLSILPSFPSDSHFWQNGVLLYYNPEVHNLLNATLWDFWNWKGVPICWPQRSPPLSLPQFSWKCLNDDVNHIGPKFLYLRRNIVSEVIIVDVGLLQNVWRSCKTRIHKIINEKCGHFEHHFHTVKFLIDW